MAKNSIRYLSSGLVGIAIGLVVATAMTQIAIGRMRPPLFREYHRIQDEIYAKYLKDGTLPAPTALSAASQEVLSKHPEIQYTAQDGLDYKYDKPYPTNLPLAGLLTLGYCWGGEEGCTGESQRPELLIHNAKLRARK